MNYLTIGHKIIDKPIIDILLEVRKQLNNGKLSTIEDKQEYVRVTCPFHKGGQERRASCSVYSGEEIEKGYFHCFTCHEKGNLSKFVGACFDKDERFGEKWLLDNFDTTYLESSLDLKPISLVKQEKPKNTILDESILDGFESYHDYFAKRKISKEIVEKFELKYNPKTREVIFPLRDELGLLVGLTKRKIDYKKYELPKVVYKPVYLLYYIEKEKVAEVYITESQINSLTLESWGYRSVALLGTGSKYQYNLLNNSGIKHFIIALDPDEAGIKGTKKLCDALNNNCFISVVLYKDKTKDINDLTKEEFDNLTVVDKCEFLNLFNSGKLLNK